MVLAVVLSFLGGLMAVNGVLHFVRGITRQEYPSVVGNSPVRNVLAGWAAFVIAAVLWYFARVPDFPLPTFIAGAIGALVIAVYHAAGGAYRLNTLAGKENP